MILATPALIAALTGLIHGSVVGIMLA